MKTTIIRSLLFISLSFVTYVHSQTTSQLLRGHNQDDMYYFDYSGSLYYLTEDGKNISLQQDSIYFSAHFNTDPVSGRLFGSYNDQLFSSNDFGMTLNQMNPIFSWDTTCGYIVGGEISGEYFLSAYHSGGYLNYYTVNSFLSTSLCTNTYSIADVGSMAGEIYSVGLIGQDAYLCHSNDYGVNFDTIPIDSLIVNNYYKMYSLSRGSKEGELYLATMIPATVWQYKIYRSTDFGSTWLQLNIPQFQSGDTKFTAGRSDCSFYISNAYYSSTPPGIILEIYATTNCGATYVKYTHDLSLLTGIKNNIKKGPDQLSIAPNPASEKVTVSYTLSIPAKVSFNIYNSLGQCVLNTTPSWEAGSIKKTISIENLKQGFYSVQIQSEGSVIATGKFIISR